MVNQKIETFALPNAADIKPTTEQEYAALATRAKAIVDDYTNVHSALGCVRNEFLDHLMIEYCIVYKTLHRYCVCWFANEALNEAERIKQRYDCYKYDGTDNLDTFADCNINFDKETSVRILSEEMTENNKSEMF
jgi:hypothetical protein